LSIEDDAGQIRHLVAGAVRVVEPSGTEHA
jgi:hypothetical protein